MGTILATTRTRSGLLAFALLVAGVAALLGSTCTPQPLAPAPGHAAWRGPAAFPVRDGVVDLAGGNLLLRRTDLTIETRLGTQAVTHVYNSATNRWSWSFEMRYAGGVFQDDTGVVHPLGSSAPGPIEGTRWRVVDAATLESRGGLRFSFAPDGRLARVAWRHAAYPRLELQRPDAATLRIAQCTAPDACTDVFLVRYQGAYVVGIVDRAGRECAYGWNVGRLAWAQTAFDREQGLPAQRYDYALAPDGRPQVLVVTNPERERVRYELDALGRTVAVTGVGEELPRWSFRHEASPLRTVVTDPLGRGAEWRFDASRRLLAHTSAGGEQTAFGWTGRRVTSVRTPDGLVASARYDGADELVEQTLASGRRIQLDPAPDAIHLADPWSALPRRVRDDAGVLVERSFDEQGRLTGETNGAGERIAFTYGPLETLTRVDLPSGLSIRFAEYGEHGQPAEVRLPAAQPGEPDFVERREFDAVGDMTRGAEPGSESGTQFPGVVARHFDAARRVRALVMSQSVHGDPQDVVFVRRSDGRVRAIQRPYGATTELDYDALGRLRSQRERVDGAWVATTVAWTPLGELAHVERANGMAVELAYDADGRPVRRANRRNGALESEVRYGWQHGRLVRKDDSTAPGPTRIDHDAQGRLRSVTWPDGERSWFGYDARDRVTSTTLRRADGQLLRQLGLRYDAAGRETRLLDGAAVVYEQVHAAGRLAEVRHGNGVVRSLSYDEFGRLSGAVSRDGAGRELERETVERSGRDFAGPDPNGPFRDTHVRYQAAAGSAPVAFAERAIGFRHVDGRRWPEGLGDSGTVHWCNGPRCDGDGDTTWLAHSGLMDLLFEQPPRTGDVRQERRFATNAERNRLHEVVLRTVTSLPRPCSPCESASEAVEHRYEWDAAGFATRRDGVAITWDATGHVASFGDASFAHDAEGRLRSSHVAGVARTRRFGGLVEADANGHALRIDLGAVDVDLVANRRSYRHFDWRGNVRSRWSDAGELQAVREYSAYGPARVHGEAGDARGFAQGLEAAGLVLLGDRLYDPAARRFLSPDPVYNAVHQYVYGAGDPAHYWDWTGRTVEETVGFQVAGGIAEGFGYVGGFVLGFALGARAGEGMAAYALGGALAVKGGQLARGWTELLYKELHAWFTAPLPKEDTLGADAPLSSAPLPSPFAGPQQPQVICRGGECQVIYGGGPRPQPGSLGGANVSFFLPAVGPSCGLLGCEPLALLGLLARRRRRSS